MGGEDDARGAREGVAEEVADALRDGGLGEDVDGARGGHGEASPFGVGLGDVCCVGGVGGDLSLVEFLHTLSECLFPRVGEPLLVQSVLCVPAPRSWSRGLLRVLCGLGDEVVGLLGEVRSRLEDIAGDGEVALYDGLEGECWLGGLGDFDVVRRLWTEGERGRGGGEGAGGQASIEEGTGLAGRPGEADRYSGRHGDGLSNGEALVCPAFEK